MRKVLSTLLLIVIGVALGGLAFEVVVRLFVPVSDPLWQWDSAVGVKLIPNLRGRAIRRGVYDASVEVNADGFRDREHVRLKPPGATRLVLLGDSFIEAVQVPFSSSIPSLLEARLRQHGINAETINLGVSGAGTARQYLILKHYGLKYRPDLVLLFFVGNDLSDNSQSLQGLSYIPYPVPDSQGSLVRDQAGRPLFTPFADQTSRLGPVAALLRHHSKGYRLVRQAIDASPNIHQLLYQARLMSTPPEPVTADPATFGFYEIYRDPYLHRWAEALSLTKDLLLEINALATENDSRFAVVLVPAAWEVYPRLWQQVLAQTPAMREASLDIDKPSRLLASFLDAHHIPYISLLPEFRERAPTAAPLYIPSDAHWTTAGHALAAELLARRLPPLLDRTTSLARVLTATETSRGRHANP